MNIKLTIFSLLIIFVFGYILWEAKKIDNKFGGSQVEMAGTVVTTLPDLQFNQFGSDEKVKIRSITESGKSIVIHFWATWCGPCEQEFPELVDLIKIVKDKKNVQFLLVAVNDDLAKMTKFLKKFDLDLDTVTLLEDKSNTHKELGTYKLPETFVFNSKNEIVKKYTGQQPWTQKYIVDQIGSL